MSKQIEYKQINTNIKTTKHYPTILQQSSKQDLLLVCGFRPVPHLWISLNSLKFTSVFWLIPVGVVKNVDGTVDEERQCYSFSVRHISITNVVRFFFAQSFRIVPQPLMVEIV